MYLSTIQLYIRTVDIHVLTYYNMLGQRMNCGVLIFILFDKHHSFIDNKNQTKQTADIVIWTYCSYVENIQ